ncbi:flagellar basal body-associated FliL family protein [Rhodalgimonas zhirmunskyi]|uniref:Flagellar protein FliL n=1 Tax=Rhodalgimonas zhirmunskyi TaxID=2964767 RepID=A0AAJ1U8Y4_9RHOB|nr:flagellar basal body-associated FliL family protein [Rhodoalgimonas zhirmunskyi]MDQ2093975.1 flagellar basal body-associated FliL family protein [Rhodoalgimonas zhirmunskyi]
MAEEHDTPVENEETAPKKKSKLLIFIAALLFLAGGGGGFYAVYSGMILGDDSHATEAVNHTDKDTHSDADSSGAPAMAEIAFVSVDPLVVSLIHGAARQHLRFRAELEVPLQYQSDVETLLPRVTDVLNSYLRALELNDLSDPAALVRLRAQMLRRIKVVVGDNRVNDLLIMEFVLN